VIGLEIERHDRVPVVSVTVDIDAFNARQIRDQLDAALGNEAVDLVLDHKNAPPVIHSVV
jgi:anti-anti-sigma regulatory factor